MSLDWPKERVVVTGGAGFLGSFVLEELRRRGARDVFVPRSRDYDLVDMAGVQLTEAGLRAPVHADHRFRSKPITDSGSKPIAERMIR